jgi:hypothetical protein
MCAVSPGALGRDRKGKDGAYVKDSEQFNVSHLRALCVSNKNIMEIAYIMLET